MNFLLSLWCRWRGHKWGRAYRDVANANKIGSEWSKVCRRCKLVAAVNKRTKVTS